MTSDELNQRIEAIADRGPFNAFGGKCVPYIGWFWRRVNFDGPDCRFGVIPHGDEDRHLVGFMENNKWDYPTVYAGPELWQEIRRLLEAAVINPSFDTFKAVNDKIQALAAGKTYEFVGDEDDEQSCWAEVG